MLRHTLLPARGRRAPRGAASARLAVALGLVLGGVAFAVVRLLLKLLADAGGSVHEAALLIGLFANFTLVGLLVFDLHEGVTVLLADSDLDLLRRAPIRPVAQLGIKLLDALPRTSLLLAVILVPAVAAFQSAFGLGAIGWALLPVQALALWAIPTGLGAAAALALLRVVPARHARELLGLVSTLTLFALWLVNSFLLPRLGGDLGPFADPRRTLDSVAHGIGWTPGGWLAIALEAAAAGVPAAALAGTLRLALAGGLAIALVAWTAHAGLESLRARIAASPPRRGRAAARVAAGAGPRGVVRAMLARDARLVGRHWTVLGDLATTVVLWTLLPLVLGPVFDAPRPLVARAMLVSLAVALGSEVAARAVPLERDAILWARLAPLAAGRWIVARALGVAVVAGGLVLAATAAVAWSLQLGVRDVAGVLAVVAPALTLALAIGVWTGAAFGDPAWSNPRAMLRPAGRLIATVLLVVQAGAWLVLALVGPPGVWATAVAAALAIAGAAAMLARAAHALARIEVATA